jgi:predicted DNA-binding transcriptional regulator YafY
VRRAERLFQIIQILRSLRPPVTAARLAEELETTTRTVYRDVAHLMALRVPIRGEAGVGYALDKSYDMPPLMLTPDEVEAAVLGAQWVAARGDPALAVGARDLLAKIRDVVPEDLRPAILEAAVVAPNYSSPEPDNLDMGRVREAIRKRTKLRIAYRDAVGAPSERTIWPIMVAYFETVRMVVAWCETRQAFRHFRTDRIVELVFLDDRFTPSLAALRRAWRAQEMEQCSASGEAGLAERPQSKAVRSTRATVEASVNAGHSKSA